MASEEQLPFHWHKARARPISHLPAEPNKHPPASPRRTQDSLRAVVSSPTSFVVCYTILVSTWPLISDSAMLPESLAVLRTVAPDKAPGGEGAEAGEGTGQCLPLAASWSLLPPEDKGRCLREWAPQSSLLAPSTTALWHACVCTHLSQ